MALYAQLEAGADSIEHTVVDLENSSKYLKKLFYTFEKSGKDLKGLQLRSVMENFPEKLVPSQRLSANLVIQLAVHLLIRSIPILDSVDVSGTGTDTAQAVRQFLKIILKPNPQQMLDFVNMDGGVRPGYGRTLLNTPLTQANCLGFPLLQADQEGDMPASLYWRMTDFVCSDLETELELCGLRDMTRISSGNHEGHQLLWDEQDGKPESTDRWTMRLNSVLEFIQPRLGIDWACRISRNIFLMTMN